MTRRVLRRRPDPMDATAALITQTANGSSIEKLADGQFRVCDNEQRCMLTSSSCCCTAKSPGYAISTVITAVTANRPFRYQFTRDESTGA